MEKFTYLGKSSFDSEPSTVIHADSVSFLTSTGVKSNSEVFADVWLTLDKLNPSVNSQWYI